MPGHPVIIPSRIFSPPPPTTYFTGDSIETLSGPVAFIKLQDLGRGGAETCLHELILSIRLRNHFYLFARLFTCGKLTPPPPPTKQNNKTKQIVLCVFRVDQQTSARYYRHVTLTCPHRGRQKVHGSSDSTDFVHRALEAMQKLKV
ncbi:hypothetical protein C0Q70_13953 [Pomacea canaliculata]|uniref:Uncharacterized protein n=1 Tax=Pomacea canaliculata TaxID=400727 RepID=A0A2T7NYS5_POMCA|nr:hypothetical protein C0Q70_13953 [Pomacea canaliculata]